MLVTPAPQKNKTPPTRSQGRNEKSCEAESRVAGVPVVVEPVPVEHNLAIVLDEIRGVLVAIGFPYDCIKCHPCHHHPRSITLGAIVEFYSASKMRQHSIPSIFIFESADSWLGHELIVHTPLYPKP